MGSIKSALAQRIYDQVTQGINDTSKGKEKLKLAISSLKELRKDPKTRKILPKLTRREMVDIISLVSNDLFYNHSDEKTNLQ